MSTNTKRVSPKKISNIRIIEDSPNGMKALRNIAEQGTFKAHQHALTISDAIVEARDGNVIKEYKGDKCSIIVRLGTRRRVVKGGRVRISHK